MTRERGQERPSQPKTAVTQLWLEGDVGDHDIVPFCRAVSALGQKPIVAVDCTCLTSITFSALARLGRTLRRMIAAGGRIVFFGLPKGQRMLLELIRADRILPLAATEEEACRLLRVPPSCLGGGTGERGIPRILWPWPNGTPMISVCIRSVGPSLLLERTLVMLAAQTVPSECLVCVDGSPEAADAIAVFMPGVRIVPRPEGPYVPAYTLNALVQAARGRRVVFLNDDAVPLDPTFLACLTAPLGDPSVAAVYANQVPRPDASPLVRKDHERAFGDGSVSCAWEMFFSLAASAFRRADLLEYPFDPIYQYSEDVAWATAAKARGLSVAYVPFACVEHSHDYSLRELARRFYHEGVADARLRGRAPRYLRAGAGALAESARDVLWAFRHGGIFRMLAGTLPRRIIQRLAFARGAHDFLTGRTER